MEKNASSNNAVVLCDQDTAEFFAVLSAAGVTLQEAAAIIEESEPES